MTYSDEANTFHSNHNEEATRLRKFEEEVVVVTGQTMDSDGVMRVGKEGGIRGDGSRMKASLMQWTKLGISSLLPYERLFWVIVVISLVWVNTTIRPQNIGFGAPSKSSLFDKDQCVEQVTTDQLFDRFGITGEWETDNDGEKMLDVMWHFHEDGVPVQINGHPYLFVGSVGAAYNKEALIKAGITHIIDATSDVPDRYVDTFHYYNIRVHDETDIDDDISVYWDESNKFIDDARRKGGKVLVHCFEGISRSVSTVAAYLEWKDGLGTDEAMDLIHETRPQGDPNDAYMHRLHELAHRLNN